MGPDSGQKPARAGFLCTKKKRVLLVLLHRLQSQSLAGSSPRSDLKPSCTRVLRYIYSTACRIPGGRAISHSLKPGEVGRLISLCLLHRCPLPWGDTGLPALAPVLFPRRSPHFRQQSRQEREGCLSLGAWVRLGTIGLRGVPVTGPQKPREERWGGGGGGRGVGGNDGRLRIRARYQIPEKRP